MAELYVPYSGRKPASMIINGHKVIILSTSKETFESDLETIGADSVKELKKIDTPQEQEKALSDIAKKTNAGVVLSPNGMQLNDVIKNLEHELPWVH